MANQHLNIIQTWVYLKAKTQAAHEHGGTVLHTAKRMVLTDPSSPLAGSRLHFATYINCS